MMSFSVQSVIFAAGTREEGCTLTCSVVYVRGSVWARTSGRCRLLLFYLSYRADVFPEAFCVVVKVENASGRGVQFAAGA